MPEDNYNSSYYGAEVDAAVASAQDYEANGYKAYPITAPSTTLGDIKTILDTINAQGKHVFFDVSALGAGMYICTIEIDADNGIYGIMDSVRRRITEGTYDASKLLTIAIANADTIASQSQIDHLQEEIDELGGSSLIKDYAVLGQKIADGTSTDYIHPGDKIDINWIKTVLGTTSKGNTVNCVDMDKFITGVGEAEAATYLFVYDGSHWTYKEESIDLADFGLTVSGTPVTGEVMTIVTTVDTVNYTFTAYDKADAHDANVQHNWTLEQTYAPDTKAYDTYEAAFILAAGKTLPAGNYKATYASQLYGTTTIYFTIAADIVNSGLTCIQFASNGYKQESSKYIPTSLTPYQLAGSTALSAAISVSLTEIAGAVDVSTVDGVTLTSSLDTATFGNNNWERSNVRQWLNDDTAGDSYLPTSDFDRPSAYNRGKGFLYGIDPRAKALIIEVDNEFTSGYGNEGYTPSQTYTSKDKVFLLSMKEMSFNINTAEGETTDLYGSYTNNTLTNDAVAARAKYNKAGGTLNSYRWSLSANVSYAYGARIVASTGALGGNGACVACYVAPAFCFGKSV